MFLPAKTVLVGVDGSQHSSRAARWAAAEAARLGASLHLVLAHDAAHRDRAEEQVREIAVECRAAEPDLHVRAQAVTADPAEDLVARSADAALLVVGSRGRGAVRDALLGSVSTAVATHAGCPVVVVRGEPRGSGPVVVGLDLSPTSRPALHFAFDRADRGGAELVVAQALPDAFFLPSILEDPERQRLQEDAEQQVGGQLAGWRERYPEVVVRRVATDQHPVEALCSQAVGARLLVVGHRSRSAAATRLGSVALGSLHHSPCPVAVVGDQVDLDW
ncbi:MULTISPECIES: universal stress protein [unclassified Saccharopolyspora]|uniref:universal stress protein n=1 Tax=unclassified Saccharopolyspora TaxID=2646250 RepID=UPI001CD6C9FF|nr:MULTISPECIES: universal stress protein [unclassified Saccharopolyspora]MCA1188571.1 universal stress protein [Saccharopolyspora sp. 6T]MCA1283289.1 universal stress protein [Saccharopolyspora sp. 7B]